MKAIYVVKGSEDGNLGVYTTTKRARHAIWDNGYKPTLKGFVTAKGLSSVLKQDGFANIECEGGSSIQIEIFIVNQ